ncbi:MAG: type I restriction endonuclease subunit R [Gammaproteobacteria bacterium]|nr:type I restriction endonuclease subunit R [Gammaproteobacteria bacterium]
MALITESIVEETAIDWLRDVEYTVIGREQMLLGASSNGDDYSLVIDLSALHASLQNINPDLSESALEEAYRKLTRPEGATLEERNRNFHRMLTTGITVEYRDKNNTIRGSQAWAIDFENPDNNFWYAVNQFTVIEGEHERRPDLVVFVNGLPLAVIEFKNPTDENATLYSAWKQLQTYKDELPTLFSMNALLVVSDALESRVGTLTSGWEWFRPWHMDYGGELATEPRLSLRTLIYEVFKKENFLSILRDFILFEDDGGGVLVKKMAGYHQFYAVKAAIYETLRAAELQQEYRTTEHELDLTGRTTKTGDRRIGVVWHTQGSGKSLTMVFYAGCIARDPAMANPTLVVLTDRNDLDQQLFGTFSRCQDLLRQQPTQAENRADLRAKLSVASGGIVFTTIQKFFPEEKGDRHPTLSERSNIVVIADEAHRSQYDFIDGFARHLRDALPHASFVGFTGTPIEIADANTRAVFGDYISVYDIQRSVSDKMTVPIYYESRLAKLDLDEEKRPNIDPDFEEVTESEETEKKEKLKTKWAQLEAIVGAERRLKQIARDIVDHFERRLEAMEGKAMIVCMSRRICVDLYQELSKIRPNWCHSDDDKGRLKIIMTGSASDGPDWQEHIRSKSRREKLAARFRNPEDPFQIVLVRDMWLTGFDAPSLHTMYIDKPMRGHGLMQAIARVNRVFRDKPGGLVVDYLGLAHELKHATRTYTEGGGEGQTTLNQEEAVNVMLEKHEICTDLFYGFDYSGWARTEQRERLELLFDALDHILQQEDGKDRFVFASRELSQAFALAVPHEKALSIRDDLEFFQAVRVALVKRESSGAVPDEDLDYAVRQIVSGAVLSEGIIDIFDATGLKKPEVEILSDAFLDEVRDLPRQNVAVEVLRRLLKGEISKQKQKNIVQARSFSDMLEQTIRKYHNRTVGVVEVLEELLQVGRDLRETGTRGEKLGLTEDELAFYDALGVNDSAVQVMGDEKLRIIACELVQAVRNNVAIDWTMRESVRAGLRVMVKRILRKHGYPPDKQEQATKTVLEQAEVLSTEWLRDPAFRQATAESI